MIEMTVNAQGAIVVVGDVMLSAWRRPYQLESLDDIARTVDAHDPGHSGALISLSVFRFDRIRPADFADLATRKKMVELSQTCRFKMAVNVLDGPGLVNSTIRLGLAGMMTVLRMPYPVTTVSSVDRALVALPEPARDTQALRAALLALEQKIWAQT